MSSSNIIHQDDLELVQLVGSAFRRQTSTSWSFSFHYDRNETMDDGFRSTRIATSPRHVAMQYLASKVTLSLKKAAFSFFVSATKLCIEHDFGIHEDDKAQSRLSRKFEHEVLGKLDAANQRRRLGNVLIMLSD
jgi:hypothetical protein